MRLLNVKQVSQQLGVSSRTVYRIVEDGELPKPLKIRNSSRWHDYEIEKYLIKHTSRR